MSWKVGSGMHRVVAVRKHFMDGNAEKKDYILDYTAGSNHNNI